jgi:hypothetical protein
VKGHLGVGLVFGMSLVLVMMALWVDLTGGAAVSKNVEIVSGMFVLEMIIPAKWIQSRQPLNRG